jgi:Ser/Thr protein kinase RdoA (MazF antagonist)
LQKINGRVFPRAELCVRNSFLVSEHLLQNNFPLAVARQISTIDGQIGHRDKAGNWWRGTEFLDNLEVFENIISAETAFEIARASGLFLRFCQNFSFENFTPALPDFHATAARFRYFLEVLDKNPAGRNGEAAELIAFFLKKNKYFERVDALIFQGILPKTLVHGDPKSGNIMLQKNGKAGAVIDFDTVMEGTILSDFGDLVRTSVPNFGENHRNFEEIDLNLAFAEAIFSGFSEGLDGKKSHFGSRENLLLGAFWIVHEQALRFLTDFLAGDIYYKINYPTHNFDRAANQLAVLTALENREKQLLKFF